MNKATPYPPELIEAAEKEYPEQMVSTYNRDTIYYDENARPRAAFLKGLSLAMPLVENAFNDGRGMEKKQFCNPKSSVLSMDDFYEALAYKFDSFDQYLKSTNFPQNDIINSHKH